MTQQAVHPKSYDEQISFLQRWYRLEYQGVSICRNLADAPSMSEHRRKWLALGRMETVTRDKVKQVLIQHAKLPELDAELEEEASQIAQAIIAKDWRQAMAELCGDLEKWLDELKKFESEAQVDFRQLARDLTRHEAAWLQFARREADGADRSLDPIERAMEEM